MTVPTITAYAALANEYPEWTEALRAATAAEAAALTDNLERRARDLLAPLDHELSNRGCSCSRHRRTGLRRSKLLRFEGNGVI